MTKKILIITDNLPEQINGVVTTYTNIEACAVLDDYSVVYITPRDFRYFDCPKYNEVKIALTRQMGKKIKEIGADYHHIATEGPLGLSARKYFSKHRVSYTTAYHTKFPEGLKKLFGVPERFTWGFVRWFHKKASVVLTTTDTMVKELQAHGFKGSVVPWTRGVDRSIFYPDQLDNRNRLTLVCVSRVSKEKNLEQFFELEYPGAHKIMVGDGPMLEEYKTNYPDVEFVGAKRGIELGDYYRYADVFVFPSRWETFGLVMIEAMACGTPVAAYPCQGPLDVVDEGITGCMNEDLKQAVKDALMLDRQKVWEGSGRWTWENAWTIFKDNLVEKSGTR
jgi:glycosyltransferase involved in cell wall biosynthesis